MNFLNVIKIVYADVKFTTAIKIFVRCAHRSKLNFSLFPG